MSMALILVCCFKIALAQPGGGYDLAWNTYDSGGQMFSSGGTYSFGGTIGQHDAGPAAGPLASGVYSLVGGFWPAAIPSCACLGDMGGAHRNGRDVQLFVGCVVSGGSCTCADINGVSGIGLDDVAPFVGDLLATTTCP